VIEKPFGSEKKPILVLDVGEPFGSEKANLVV